MSMVFENNGNGVGEYQGSLALALRITHARFDLQSFLTNGKSCQTGLSRL
jgi:hypothetical protein